MNINNIKNNDKFTITMFGKPKTVRVFSSGDNQFDENGDYKQDDFEFNEAEINCVNWFISNIRIDDYRNEILEYSNNMYNDIGEDSITIEDLEDEIDIFAIAVNISEIRKSKSGFVYPEISFYGNCKCDPEHGICIGFRDKKFLGIESQDWTL